MEWREILCQTNIRPGTVQALQTALLKAGHNPGAIDGVVGRDTLRAVRAYQTQKGLPTGGLMLATLSSLGVEVTR
jgi:peptidoglycan hydrolase-like protein with peptidoglycan-binding domain